MPPEGPLFALYVPHVSMVTAKAVDAGKRLGLSEERLRFIEEACLLHDIGIVRTNTPELHCHGDLPYLLHGVEGRFMLESLGLPEHARVAENHVGVGITRQEIEENGLDLPLRDMLPQTLEEKMICWADKFFSKKPGSLWTEYTFVQAFERIQRYGEAPSQRFLELHTLCTSTS